LIHTEIFGEIPQAPHMNVTFEFILFACRSSENLTHPNYLTNLDVQNDIYHTTDFGGGIAQVIERFEK
jgi:hypothetical protein